MIGQHPPILKAKPIYRRGSRHFVTCPVLVLSSGRIGGGLWLDIKRKLPWYCSDIYDGFHIQSISAVLFIYLGCITNAITFGGLLGDATDNYQVFHKNCDIVTWFRNHQASTISDSCFSFPYLFQGSDGELPWHCFGRDCVLFIWWSAAHHPQFNWTHSHLWEAAFWIQQVRVSQTKSM